MTSSTTFEKPATPTLLDIKKNFLAFVTAFAEGMETPIVEVRALDKPRGNYKPQTMGGYFNLSDPVKLWKAVAPLRDARPTEQPTGVYLTINPVTPELIGTADHRLKDSKQYTAAQDIHVVRRVHLMIDCDPAKAFGINKISATDAEKAEAWKLATSVREDLEGRGCPSPLVIDTGNGFHLLYKIDAPVDDDEMIQRILHRLDRKHSTPKANIDLSVYNPSRITKLPGTWARKGDDVPDRPHRLAWLLEAPSPCPV